MSKTSRIVLTQKAGVLGLVALSMAGCFGSSPTQPRKALTDNRSAVPASTSNPAPTTGLNALGSATNIEVPAKPSREELPRLAQEQADILNRLIAEGIIKPDAVINPNAAKLIQPVPAPGPTSVARETTIYNTPGPVATRPTPGSPANPTAGSLPPSPATITPAAPAPAVPSAGLSSITGETPQPPTTQPTNTQPPPTAVVETPAIKSVDDRINSNADELAKSLRERMTTSREPVSEFLALAWLDSIRPGVLGSLESGPAARLLDPQQTKSIAATRDVAAALVRAPDAVGSPEQMWQTVTKAAEPIVGARDIRVTTAELCLKVDGFGQYAPVPSRSLLAGTNHRLVVYTEVEGFAHRNMVDADGTQRSVVEIAQAIEIWQDADRPTLQKRWNESALKDISRRVRRDFFLTTVIDLPQTLSVGSYNLKIIVKDVVHNSIAEHVIPFRMVADASLATSTTR